MIRWSKRAFTDYTSIHNFIATDNPEAAREQCSRIYASVDQLRKFPRSGKPGRTLGDRLLAVPGTPYIVSYRLKVSTILLRRIRHGAQLPR